MPRRPAAGTTRRPPAPPAAIAGPASSSATLIAMAICAVMNSNPNSAENQSGSVVIAQSTDASVAVTR